MSLVERDDMTTLRPASESKQTAINAEKDQQLKAIAYAINNAANTGELTTVYQGVMLDEVKEELVSNGYTLKNFGEINPENRTLISWKTLGE